MPQRVGKPVGGGCSWFFTRKLRLSQPACGGSPNLFRAETTLVGCVFSRSWIVVNVRQHLKIRIFSNFWGPQNPFPPPPHNGISLHYVCLHNCLGSYISPKANGSIARRRNRMICLQTWADGDFLRFLVVFKRFCTKNPSKSSKNEILWTWWLTLESEKKFSVGHQHPLCVFG